MSKKTLILSQSQLDEICGGDSSYLDGLGSNVDMGDIFSNEITSDGAIDGEFPDPTTTDDFKADVGVNDWRGNAKLGGLGPITVREMTKREWSSHYVVSEEEQHGNKRLKNRQFGAANGEQGKSYDATKMAISRLGNAQKTMNTGETQTERNKAAKTVQRMKQNWGNIGLASQQYKTAKNLDKLTQQSKIGPKIQSAPKTSGNGKAHTGKNSGIITYQS